MHDDSAFPDVLPVLSAGHHRDPRDGGCLMEWVSLLAGERWSDHPACTHPLLALLARDVNDLISDPGRAGLMPLVTRVIGLNGDDPRVSSTIAVIAASAALPVASMERQRALAAGLIGLIAAADSDELTSIAHDAFSQAPDAERWAKTYLAASAFTPRFDGHAETAIVHTSVVGIALACVTDADARLAALLERCIDASERILRPIAAERTALQPA